MAEQADRYRVRRHVRGGGFSSAPDDIAGEEPLEIRVAGRAVSVTMRTPGYDDELAAGFLVGEGILSRRADLEHVRRCDRDSGALVDVLVSPGVAVDFARLTRHVFASSSCGVCGSATIDAVRQKFEPAREGPRVDPELFYTLAEQLRRAQPTFDRTGGLHGAAVFDHAGRLLVAREDVGRHNAVDKVIGHAFLAGLLPLGSHILMVSGRASFEIVQKALSAGIPIVAAVSAPSTLAIDLADESNITLVGFLRERGFNVYAHPERVGGEE
jgi:FdhD protein